MSAFWKCQSEPHTCAQSCLETLEHQDAQSQESPVSLSGEHVVSAGAHLRQSPFPWKCEGSRTQSMSEGHSKHNKLLGTFLQNVCDTEFWFSATQLTMV